MSGNQVYGGTGGGACAGCGQFVPNCHCFDQPAPCLCDEIDPADRPCIVCEAAAFQADQESRP